MWDPDPDPPAQVQTSMGTMASLDPIGGSRFCSLRNCRGNCTTKPRIFFSSSWARAGSSFSRPGLARYSSSSRMLLTSLEGRQRNTWEKEGWARVQTVLDSPTILKQQQQQNPDHLLVDGGVPSAGGHPDLLVEVIADGVRDIDGGIRVSSQNGPVRETSGGKGGIDSPHVYITFSEDKHWIK